MSMKTSFLEILAAALLAINYGAPIIEAHSLNSTQSSVVDATYDGKCFYPKPAKAFELNSYLGRWYQVAGTPAPFTAGCKCTQADYSLNANGIVNVLNACEIGGQEVHVQGTATPVSESSGYGNQEC